MWGVQQGGQGGGFWEPCPHREDHTAHCQPGGKIQIQNSKHVSTEQGWLRHRRKVGKPRSRTIIRQDRLTFLRSRKNTRKHKTVPTATQAKERALQAHLPSSG